jgi:20S proteasome alpha/beta subunit
MKVPMFTHDFTSERRYEHSHNMKMSCSAVAQLLSVTLYYRRFFPYYAFCMVGGIDEDGEGPALASQLRMPALTNPIYY